MKLFGVLIALVLCVSSAHAAQIDFSAPMLDLDGKPVPDCTGSDCENKPVLTLGLIAVRALMNMYPDERDLQLDEKLKRSELARRIYPNKRVDLSAEEIALIKKLIAKAYGPLVVGDAVQLLDPPAEKK